LIHDRHIGYFWFKTGIPNISNIVCVQSIICDIITKTKYYFRYLLKSHGAHREIYKTTGVSIEKKIMVLNFKEKKIMGVARPRATPMGHGGGLATPRPNGVADPPPSQLEVAEPPYIFSHNFFFLIFFF
jgi:hypothetical protein